MVAQKGKDLLAQDSISTAWRFRHRRRDCAPSGSPSTARPSTLPTRIRPAAGANCSPEAACSARRSAVRASSRTRQSDAAIRSRFFAGEIVDWQLAVPDFGTVARTVPDHVARIYRQP